MNPNQFLERWKSEHINSGTQQADIPKLLEQLVGDAEQNDISSGELSRSAGGGLVKFLMDAISESVEEELR
jgi:hypothetical protein